MVNGLIESVPKSKVGEGGRERVHRLIEVLPEREVGE